jgi:hypothetical protein
MREQDESLLRWCKGLRIDAMGVATVGVLTGLIKLLMEAFASEPY